MGDVVVKVDKKLLKKVEEIIEKNRFLYSSKKQVVNLALVEFLSKNKLTNNKKKRQARNLSRKLKGGKGKI